MDYRPFEFDTRLAGDTLVQALPYVLWARATGAGARAWSAQCSGRTVGELRTAARNRGFEQYQILPMGERPVEYGAETGGE